MRVPWTARRANQSIEKEISPEYSFIGRTDAEAGAPILGPPDVKSRLLGKTLVLEKTEGKRRRRQQKMRLLNSVTNSMDMNLSKLLEIVEDRGVCHTQSMGFKESDTTE